MRFNGQPEFRPISWGIIDAAPFRRREWIHPKTTFLEKLGDLFTNTKRFSIERTVGFDKHSVTLITSQRRSQRIVALNYSFYQPGTGEVTVTSSNLNEREFVVQDALRTFVGMWREGYGGSKIYFGEHGETTQFEGDIMFDQELLQNKPGTRRQIIEAIVHLVTDMSKKSTQARRDSMRFLGAENEDQRLNAAKLLENMVININEDVPEPLQTLFEFE